MRIWFDPPMLRWRRVLGVTTVGVVAVVAWLAHERGAWRVDDGFDGLARSGEPAFEAVPATVPAPRVAAPTVAPSPPATVPPAAAPAATAASGRDDCSVATAAPGAGSAAAATDPLRAARARWLDHLEAQADPVVRAAGWLWLTRAPAPAADDFERAAARDRLARLAVDTRDPRLYGLAMLGCDARPASAPAGACQMLSADAWGHVDADNAAVWLAIAERTGTGAQAQAEALRRAVLAPALRLRGAELLTLARSAIPGGLSDVEHAVLSAELVAIQSGFATPLGGATEYCSRAQLVDVNRRGECEALATMFLERGATLAHFIAGRSLAENLGWPSDRLLGLRRESESLAALAVVPPAETSCRALERRTQRALDAARIGELEALRRELRAGMPSAARP